MKKINKILLLLVCAFSVASVFAMEKPEIKTCCEGHFDDSIDVIYEYLEDEASYLQYIRSNEKLANVEAAMREIWEIVEEWDKYTNSIESSGRRIRAVLAARSL